MWCLYFAFFSCRRSNTKLFISKLIQVLLSLKEILPPTSQVHITGVVNTFVATITNENALDGIISAVDTLKGVVLSLSDGYRQATGNGKQAELISNLLTECLEGMSHLQHLQKRASDGKDVAISLCVKVVVCENMSFCLSQDDYFYICYVCYNS